MIIFDADDPLVLNGTYDNAAEGEPPHVDITVEATAGVVPLERDQPLFARMRG